MKVVIFLSNNAICLNSDFIKLGIGSFLALLSALTLLMINEWLRLTRSKREGRFRIAVVVRQLEKAIESDYCSEECAFLVENFLRASSLLGSDSINVEAEENFFSIIRNWKNELYLQDGNRYKKRQQDLKILTDLLTRITLKS
jgi:hypothetical protein